MSNHNPATSTEAFSRLLETWNLHQDLRSGGATPAELWASRSELDQRRLEVRLAA